MWLLLYGFCLTRMRIGFATLQDLHLTCPITFGLMIIRYAGNAFLKSLSRIQLSLLSFALKNIKGENMISLFNKKILVFIWINITYLIYCFLRMGNIPVESDFARSVAFLELFYEAWIYYPVINLLFFAALKTKLYGNVYIVGFGIILYYYMARFTNILMNCQTPCDAGLLINFGINICLIITVIIFMIQKSKQKMPRKKLISIDLDGVLNTYSGNYAKNEIAPVKDGAFEFLQKLSEDYRIAIFTVRDKTLVRNWLIQNDLIQFVEDITDVKNPFSSIFLDDRAINFDGDFDKTYRLIKNFKPYWK